MAQSVEVYFAYSRKDEALQKRLETHLALLQRQGLITTWNNQKISPGQVWQREIGAHLSSAQIILLLISADFIASNYCYSIEMAYALERHRRDEARVIPILLKDCDRQGVPFAHLQWLPSNGRPITRWSNRDAAFADVTREIRRVIDELADSSRSATLQSNRDFCIYYDKTDYNWAEWIAWQLENDGHSTTLRAWDTSPAVDFSRNINRVIQESGHTIIILSPGSVETLSTQPERRAAFSGHLSGKQSKMLAVRVAAFNASAILGEIPYVDLAGLNESKAREKLLRAVPTTWDKPLTQLTRPIFPRTVPQALAFPGTSPGPSRRTVVGTLAGGIAALIGGGAAWWATTHHNLLQPVEQITPTPSVSSNTPSPSTSPTSPAASPTISVTPGQVLYTADFSKPNNIYKEWQWNVATGDKAWEIQNGVLRSLGKTTNDTIWANKLLPTANYAVEAQIQVLSLPDGISYSGPAFGLLVRGRPDYQPGYLLEITGSFKLDTPEFSTMNIAGPDQALGHYPVDLQPHMYRVEVRNNVLTFSIDKDKNTTYTYTDASNVYPASGQVGLMTSLLRVQVSSFKVITL